MSWLDVGPLASLPARGARVVRVGDASIAVFRTSAGEVYALRDVCPHRGGPLSQGIVHGDRVTCPLHDWVIDLRSGRATGADEGSTPTFPVRVADGRVSIEVPDTLGRCLTPLVSDTNARDTDARNQRAADDACGLALFERA
ncbi:MAG TPA: nitrite reductase small subunit NirD [Gammaproteobacteria bacterium]|nr:nitrite reductase small subunit NirD [Gammaproteobacteria bacterium]